MKQERLHPQTPATSRTSRFSGRETRTIKLCALLVAVLLGSQAAAQTTCDHVGAYIVNLSQDNRDVDGSSACTSRSSRAAILDCVTERIEDNVPQACENFDVFVPGTAAEHGAWKQFNYAFGTDNNRGHLVIQYQDAIDVEDLDNFDGAKYDEGVIDARSSLHLLLDALQRDFPSAALRVFGHSKGSHAVAMVADDGYADVEFYAFAQPGRTNVDIDNDADIGAALKGDAGYIHKLSSNLVGITWANDEVQFYEGNGTSGFPVPRIWSFPGLINDETADGGNPLQFRIDHHNNYGGRYTDGISGNRWREGEGTEKPGFPYCATGDSSEFGVGGPFGIGECEKDESKPVSFLPYFWGNPHCEAKAFEAMGRYAVGARYRIGNSGPRSFRSCRENNGAIEVDYELEYQFNLSDKDCTFNLRFEFRELGSDDAMSSFKVSANQDNDSDTPNWKYDSGELLVPYHMELWILASIVQRGNGNCSSALVSESFVNELSLTFRHPVSGERVSRTVIGLDEGQSGSGNLSGDRDTAWRQPNSSEEIKMRYYSPLTALEISDTPDIGDRGNFYKVLHLLD